MCDGQMGLVNRVPEGIASLKALYLGGKFAVVGVLLTCIGSVEVGISPLVAMDSSVVVGDKSSMSDEAGGIDTRGEVWSQKGTPSSKGSHVGFQ